MSETLKQKMTGIEGVLRQNPVQASMMFHEIQKTLADSIWDGSFEYCRDLAAALNRSALNAHPEDDRSYFLGKVQGMQDFLMYLEVHIKLRMEVSAVDGYELKILKLLQKHDEMTPSQIKGVLDITKQHTSNILRKLRERNAVYVFPAGRHNWYSLSSNGKRMMKEVDQTPDIEYNLRIFREKFISFSMRSKPDEWRDNRKQELRIYFQKQNNDEIPIKRPDWQQDLLQGRPEDASFRLAEPSKESANIKGNRLAEIFAEKQDKLEFGNQEMEKIRENFIAKFRKEDEPCPKQKAS